ncbi:MAG TPA: hypothetical protein VGG48_14310 [Rhizomicrobium sp.]|jgi:hypothetical protein
MSEKSIVTVFPFSAPGAARGQVSVADISLVSPNSLEQFAAAHWRFGTDATSLTEPLNSHVLTPAIAPTYSENYLTLANAAFGGLTSDILDSNSMTVCLVAQYELPATSNQTVLVSTRTASAGNDGLLVYIDSAGVIHYDPILASGAVNVPLVAPALNAGDWFFLALTADHANLQTRAFVGGGTLLQEASDALPANPTHGITLGNDGYFNVNTYKTGTSFAELIYFPTPLTHDQVLRVYLRAKLRLRDTAGITLV